MDINRISNTNFNGQGNLTNTLGNTEPSKIEVIVGALTENDVKDHGTATGVVKTVSKVKRKPKAHAVGQLEKRDKPEIKDLVESISKSPKEAISAQANLLPEAVFKLLE